jgi:PadR family transcriptional regulator PadR
MGAMKATRSSEFLPGTLDMLILRTLTVGPLHGYGIAQFIRQKSEDVLQVGEGSLYPALQRLRVQGYIKAEWGESENKRRARYYRLTRKGEKQLEQEVVSFNRLMEAIARVMQPT